jgi:hypothetical protein
MATSTVRNARTGSSSPGDKALRLARVPGVKPKENVVSSLVQQSFHYRVKHLLYPTKETVQPGHLKELRLGFRPRQQGLHLLSLGCRQHKGLPPRTKQVHRAEQTLKLINSAVQRARRSAPPDSVRPPLRASHSDLLKLPCRRNPRRPKHSDTQRQARVASRQSNKPESSRALFFPRAWPWHYRWSIWSGPPDAESISTTSANEQVIPEIPS